MAKVFKKGIHIYQKGGMKNHGLILAAAKFYAKELMSTRMVNTLSIRIELRATKLKKSTYGVCSILNNGSDKTREFTIILQRGILVTDQLLTLAHEMVHVQQGASKRLQYRQWKSDKQLHARWEGKELGVLSAIPYRKQPWEIEAFSKEMALFKKFCLTTTSL